MDTRLDEAQQVGLFGTTNGDPSYRYRLIEILKELNTTSFNPFIHGWGSDPSIDYAGLENFHKKNDEVVLLIVTPTQSGDLSAWEGGRTSLLRKNKFVFSYMPQCDITPGTRVAMPIRGIEDESVSGRYHMQDHQLKSLKAMGEDVIEDGGTFVEPAEVFDLEQYLQDVARAVVAALQS